MDTLQIVVLALLQGLTEFLPISSSAHLILVPAIVGWPDQGLAFDVAVHVGALLAVILYFRQQISFITLDFIQSLIKRRIVGESNLAWAIIIATIPTVIAALLFKDFVENELRSPLVISAATVVFGFILWWADLSGKRQRSEYSIHWVDAIIIGLAQAIALIPGTSRSGITMTAALLLGFNRESAARFSFLLSIPAIAGAGLFKTKDLIESQLPVDWYALGLGTVISFVSAYLCIHLFLSLLEKLGFTPFVIYRLALGLILFILFWPT